MKKRKIRRKQMNGNRYQEASDPDTVIRSKLSIRMPAFTAKNQHSFSKIRVNLDAVQDPPKVIGIGGGKAGEGASTVTLGLAQVLSEFGKKVVLVDTDLRTSTIRDYIETDHLYHTGMDSLLDGSIYLQEAVCQTDHDNLDVIPSLKKLTDPLQIIDLARVDHLFEELRKRYDVILVDLHPLNELTDSLAFVRNCDGIILVVRRNSISSQSLLDMMQEIEGQGSSVIGAILNHH